MSDGDQTPGGRGGGRAARIGLWLGPALALGVWALPTPDGLRPEAHRLAAVTVWMATQAAHGQAVAVVVPMAQLDKARLAIREELEIEFERAEVAIGKGFKYAAASNVPPDSGRDSLSAIKGSTGSTPLLS